MCVWQNILLAWRRRLAPPLPQKCLAVPQAHDHGKALCGAMLARTAAIVAAMASLQRFKNRWVDGGPIWAEMVLINYTLPLRPLSPFGKSEALLTGVSLQSSLAYRSIAHPPCLSQYCNPSLPISSWVEQIHHDHGALCHGLSASPFLASKRPHVGAAHCSPRSRHPHVSPPYLSPGLPPHNVSAWLRANVPAGGCCSSTSRD